MKIPKKLRTQLEAICRNLEAGHRYILSDSVAIMVEHRLGSCDFFECVAYPPYKGQKWSPIVKACGNPFVPAITAVNQLRAILDAPEKPAIHELRQPHPTVA